MMAGPLLEARAISVAYGKIEAVRGVSLKVAPGQIVAVIGPNGAGKTSLLNALMGLLPSKGEVFYGGESAADLSTEDRVDRGLCIVPEKRELFGDMSVADNLMLGAFARHARGEKGLDAERDRIYALFLRLRERQVQRAATLSGGERQMLAVGRALMAKPRLLMLDEPSLGLAPLIVREIFRTIVSLRAHGVSLLIVEQNARAALQVSDYGYVIERGEVVLEGAAADLAQNPLVMASYLGLARDGAALG